MEVRKEQLAIIERQAKSGARRLGRWCGDQEQLIGSSYYERMYHAGCLALLRLPRELDEAGFSRWIWRSIWNESCRVYARVRDRTRAGLAARWAIPDSWEAYRVYESQLEARSDLWKLRERMSGAELELLSAYARCGSALGAAKELTQSGGHRSIAYTRDQITDVLKRAREILAE